MKKLLSVLTLMVMASVWVAAQVNTAAPAAPAPADENGPVMTLETTEVDYGKIEQGSDPYRVFKFTNTGKAPLVIENAKGSCGCTVPSYSKEPIAPGEASEIKVRYDTNRIGKFTKTVTLTTNEAVQTRTLRISGEVYAKPTEPEGVPASTGGFNN
ncbi:MAG: DUF1573 domain-containing protein [Lewinellaceae bacterium]|nr:DUF1573 domain-containing protein [Lewinellaceae bacterium]